MPAAALLATDTALFLAGDAVMRRMLWHAPLRFRAGAAVVALATIPAGGAAGLLTQIGLLTAIIVITLLAERDRDPATAGDGTDNTAGDS